MATSVDHCVVWCALLKTAYLCASMLAHVFSNCCLYFSRIWFLDGVCALFQTFAFFIDLKAVEGPFKLTRRKNDGA